VRLHLERCGVYEKAIGLSEKGSVCRMIAVWLQSCSDRPSVSWKGRFNRVRPFCPLECQFRSSKGKCSEVPRGQRGRPRYPEACRKIGVLRESASNPEDFHLACGGLGRSRLQEEYRKRKRDQQEEPRAEQAGWNPVLMRFFHVLRDT